MLIAYSDIATRFSQYQAELSAVVWDARKVHTTQRSRWLDAVPPVPAAHVVGELVRLVAEITSVEGADEDAVWRWCGDLYKHVLNLHKQGL